MEIITKLEQYYAMKQEAKDLRQRIEAGERYLAEMEKEGCQVSDTVTGTRKRRDNRSNLCHRISDSGI